MWSFNLFLSALFTSVLGFPQTLNLNEGDSCRLENGGSGQCKKLLECASAIYDIDEYGKWPLNCTSGKFERIVCCDISKMTTTESTSTTTTTTTTTTRKPPTTNAGQIAKKKCQEYSTWISPPTLFPGSHIAKTAGVCYISVEKFIIGGQRAATAEFPHMAHLGYGDEENPSFQCGASLISEQYLLTAAHCLYPKDGTRLVVAKLGADDKGTEKIFKMKRSGLIPHPDWNPPFHYNDIALIRLEEPLDEFFDFMRPACVQAETNLKAPDGVASGWGLTEYNGKQSETLLKVALPFVNHTQCSKIFRRNFLLGRGIDEDSMFCAGGDHKLHKDTCQGDSGGPIQVAQKEPECMYNIVGITSFGINCGIAPGVYTRVSNYVSWIESVVWPNEK